jgi:large subunit ribosomal protein L18
MGKVNKNYIARKRRQARVRKRVSGTPERPRLNVYRSLNHIYAQVIDDINGVTVAAASTVDSELKAAASLSDKSRTERAALVGKTVAERALDAGIKEVVFDRGGYKYHGRIKALAEASREAGLKF